MVGVSADGLRDLQRRLCLPVAGSTFGAVRDCRSGVASTATGSGGFLPTLGDARDGRGDARGDGGGAPVDAIARPGGCGVTGLLRGLGRGLGGACLEKV